MDPEDMPQLVAEIPFGMPGRAGKPDIAISLRLTESGLTILLMPTKWLTQKIRK
jgi:hypothetical protein